MLTAIYSHVHFPYIFFIKYVGPWLWRSLDKLPMLPISKSNPAMTTLWQQLCILW